VETRDGRRKQCRRNPLAGIKFGLCDPKINRIIDLSWTGVHGGAIIDPRVVGDFVGATIYTRELAQSNGTIWEKRREGHRAGFPQKGRPEDGEELVESLWGKWGGCGRGRSGRAVRGLGGYVRDEGEFRVLLASKESSKADGAGRNNDRPFIRHGGISQIDRPDLRTSSPSIPRPFFPFLVALVIVFFFLCPLSCHAPSVSLNFSGHPHRVFCHSACLPRFSPSLRKYSMGNDGVLWKGPLRPLELL